MSTTIAPPRPATDTDIDKKTRGPGSGGQTGTGEDDDFDEADVRKKGPIEYLEDDLDISRDNEDPFHILLLGETYEKAKMTVNYVSGNLQMILEMPYEDAVEASVFAKDMGMSCLGVWTREKCLDLGKQLQGRDLIVRVVPFAQGGQRGWQANKDAADNSNYNDASSQNGGADFEDAEYWR